MIVRHDVNVETMGKMAELPPDLSPLQIGTRGEMDGLSFTLLGRVRFAYDEGSWNEWCALFSDGRHGWVAEAQGFFMVSFEVTPPPQFPTGSGGLPINCTIEIEGQDYSVTDRKENVCLGSEGELTIVAPPGRTATTIDLTGSNARFASAEYAENGMRLFVGRYARFDDLKFSNLKPVPGWSEEAIEPIRNQTTSVQCPNCAGTVVIRAPGLTMSATCGSCGSLIDTSMPDLTLIRRAAAAQTRTPKIPIGRRGMLSGVNYEVIGFQHVKDDTSGWYEYLLFNPWQGFVWLVNYGGHWSFVRRLFEQPALDQAVSNQSATYATFKNEHYRLFAEGRVTTDFVIGEFYWKVKIGMTTRVSDFISPPLILSRERYPNLEEETWSQGEYVDHEVIQKAFNLEQHLSEPTGIYLNQPNRFLHKARELGWLVPLLIVTLLAIQIASTMRAAHKPVFSGDFMYQGGATNQSSVSEPFEIPGGSQALQYTVQAPVDNAWLELDIDLVNADTHQVVANHVQEVAYYHGSDSDGYWSEGHRTSSEVVPAVPSGKYYLALDASADPSVQSTSFKVTVVRDVIIWSNFWIALGVLLLYPVYVWIRSWMFERARWMESDFTPSIYSLSTDND